MTDSELKQVLIAHKLWLETNGKKGERATFIDANLANSNLTGADLRHADLSGTYLVRANLADADLSYANLRRAELPYANLTGVDLRGSDLTGADLSAADLTEANLPLSIRDCWSFRQAKFSPSTLPWLILHPEWAEFKDTVQIGD